MITLAALTVTVTPRDDLSADTRSGDGSEAGGSAPVPVLNIRLVFGQQE